MELTPEEVRVLGCLVEKELTTPQQYPLTLNALVLACNQLSNREPVVSYDERTVEEAVTRSKGRGLARFVHPSHGRSAIRYRHELDSQLGLDRRQLALLSVLMVRGPQTPGELRARTERMAAFDTLADVESELRALADRQEPLVVRLARAPGRKEDRFAAALEPVPAARGDGDAGTAAATAATGSPGYDGPALPPPGAGTADVPSPEVDAAPVSSGPGIAALAAELRRLRAEVEDLRRRLDDLRQQLGA